MPHSPAQHSLVLRTCLGVDAVVAGASKLLVALLLICMSTLVLARTAWAADESPSQVDEWFEREVRPLLAERCLSCHSSSLEAPKANLKLDRRDLALAGGDSGPAIELGKPTESLLMQAVRGQGMDRMPPDKPLTKLEIATFERWITLGAPWPERPSQSLSTGPDWLRERASTHWSWQAMRDVQPPAISNVQWTKRGIDAFVLAKLDRLEISPTRSATPTQLLRRLAFDLTGLPPTQAQIARFASLDSCDDGDFEAAYQATLEQLLASPEFGVTWGRHWFDLVRYCETLGHEFDYPVRHAWRYRDAVIDALNGDLSYAEFVREHMAGDRTDAPRRHPTSGVNQSLAMTGWWWMGEGLHAPVDIWGDEATRIDNQIDVYSKAFLGLTVACARCHDHKFDAISAADYTSLVGVLQSSRRTYAFDDPHGRIAHHNERLSEELDKAIANASVRANTSKVNQWLESVLEKLAAQLPEARQKITSAQPLFPLLLLAETSSNEHFAQQRAQRLSVIEQQQTALDQWYQQSVQLANFSDGLPKGWYVEAADGSLAKHCTQPAKLLAFDPVGILPARPATFTSHALGRQQRLALRSPTFDVSYPIVALRMRGKSAQSAVVVDNYFMNEFTGLLFGDLRKPLDQPHDFGWVVHGGDLNKYLGHPAYVSIEDDENAWFELSEVRLANTAPPIEPSPLAIELLQASTTREQLTAALLKALIAATDDSLGDVPGSEPGNEPGKPAADSVALLRAAIMLGNPLELPFPLDASLKIDKESLEGLAAATPPPVQLMGIHEGTPRDAEQTLRGNPHQRSERQPRRELMAMGGTRFEDPASSGRWELARWLTSASHPLTSRVMVNRVWHHLFGQGLVDSPDNFGLLGGAPSHAELLDNLALQFIEHDWSIKWLVREICSSQTYQLSSLASSQQLEVDPSARFLSHRTLRRLSAEKIRDTMLSISGSIDRAHEGESIKVHLTDQMTGRGRPTASGPLDGQGRRAAFIEIRRNFLDPFLVAFDQPPPATSVGKRNQSNVPAQALSMLNDPLVHALADRWSERLLNEYKTHPERVEQMMQSAFARLPTDQELQMCLQLLCDQTSNGDPRDLFANANANANAAKLAQLAHVIMCSKEFLYLQ